MGKINFSSGPIPEVNRGINGASSTAIRFTDGTGGCCTTAYCYSLSEEQKNDLAERIMLALNATRHLSTKDLERLVASQKKHQS